MYICCSMNATSINVYQTVKQDCCTMSDFSDELKPASPQGPEILAKERRKSHIIVEQLAQHLLHRGDHLKRQAKILPILERCPIFSKKNQLNLARPDRYHLSLARSKELRRMSLQHGWDIEDYKVAQFLVDEVSPYALHTLMFMTSIREQASEDQLREWMPKIESWEIIGCYGQTELGHGSNVRALETLATYNPETEDFTIHSPTLTAAKWWNGSLGRTANHAIVIAQLLLPENEQLKSFGPHQFVVQIRDIKTNKPLEGIVIGDIGPKVGYAGMDNGYMLFKNFKIPHKALLSKHSGVDIDGKYIAPQNQAVVYGSMTFVRASIIMAARFTLARACTIAVRYLSIRRQFADRDHGGPEVAVLDYPSVQVRVLPLLAATYAMHYTGEAMFNLYSETRADIEQRGDLSRLAELHAASSGLKSACTLITADGSEICRRALGGHGFSAASGMIPLNTDKLDGPTVEGDNFMLSQQTAAYLIKRMTVAVAGKPSERIDLQFAAYLKEGPTSNYDIYTNDADIVRLFKERVSYLTYKVYESKIVKKQPWTSLMVQLHRLAMVHSESIMVENFYKAVFTNEPSPPIDDTARGVLQDLFRLFSFTIIEAKSTEFILSGALKIPHLYNLAPKIQELLSAIRPHAVRLVDAWSIPDYLLDSSLGRHDGDVYNSLWQKAHLENPLNMTTFNPDFRTEEIVMGEGAEIARKRIEDMALGVYWHEQMLANSKARL
ncbi:acyl-CoA oxidase [Tothia fuscella]|uniref:Acyl-coenzyme A oxidase n=1 Tax=Tothia fuscella TaxID=1048955 RepID=A0A9P4NP18_9PEZI|nr:acyl-CoA oxidase [Tothia fuscella]